MNEPRERSDNLNDPGASPADEADHRARTEEIRKDAELTGGRNDNEGHTPRIPSSPATQKS